MREISFYEQDSNSSYSGDGLYFSLRGNFLQVEGDAVVNSQGRRGLHVQPYKWAGPVNRARVVELFGERVAVRLFDE